MLRDESVGHEASWCGVEGERDHDEQCTKLHRTLKRIVKARGSLDAQEAEALREAERLRLWRHFGYGSLIEYMELEMGYPPRAALERLRVAKAIETLPAIADAMAQGDLSFSAGRELTRVANPETEGEWLAAAQDKNVHQVEDMVSGHKQGDRPSDPVDPTLRKRRLRYDEIEQETIVILRQARQILEREHGERLNDNAFLRMYARMIIDGARSPERTHAPYQVAVTVCEECKRGWQSGGGRTVEMSPPTLETAMCDAVHIGSIGGVASNRAGNDRTATPAPSPTAPSATAPSPAASSPTASSPAKPLERAKSDIPPALRRKVKHRDHGRCRVPWCRSSRNCDHHHIVPVSQGGEHTEENLLTLCESHHLAHHGGALSITGTASNAVFERRAHNALAIAERALETKAALKALGFDKDEIKAAMDKTHTHVGTAELSLEQWIKIALGYCPKPHA
jgi:hypothetical protein